MSKKEKVIELDGFTKEQKEMFEKNIKVIQDNVVIRVLIDVTDWAKTNNMNLDELTEYIEGKYNSSKEVEEDELDTEE